MKLLIAIPALNEQDSIEGVIRRSLDARTHILKNSPVREIEIVVVSDGSTDRTVELARRYVPRIGLIVFEHNRGYGAAIKEAWKDNDADLLGFLDADGTCDPLFFADLCDRLLAEEAGLAIGCRLNRHTQMPAIRQIGNLIFGSLLTVASNTRIRDTASGMRVLRSEAYRELLPLPDGLHFTPAMTARALLGSDRMKFIEIDMPYHEREGKSKLNVFRDGFRFLRIIFEALFLYRPARPLALVGLAFGAIALALMATPVVHYVTTHTVDEWMLYRFIIGHLAATTACLMFSVAMVSRRVVQITIGAEYCSRGPKGWLDRAFLGPYFWLIPGLLIVFGIALIAPSIATKAAGRGIYEHWSRFMTTSFLLLVAVILISGRCLTYFLHLVSEQLSYLQSQAKTEELKRASRASAGY